MSVLCASAYLATAAVSGCRASRGKRLPAAAAARSRQIAIPQNVPCYDCVSTPSRERRGVSLITHGKRKKGFAEMMGGGDVDVMVAVTKKGAPVSDAETCPCGGGDEKAPYSRCCKPYHKGEKYPADCVTLMRSRFTGYAKGEGEYVVRTTHPENPLFAGGAKAASGVFVSSLADDVRATCKKVKFYDLEIVSDKKKSQDEHLVGFRYKCRVVGQKGFTESAEEKHSELSTFRRGDGGEWLFLDGITGAVDS